MPQSIIAIISCVVATLIFTVCLRLQKSSYVLLILLIAPVITLIVVNPEWAVEGWHEFLHASIVYNIINGTVPPEDVLLAGHPLKYPWAHHYLVALLCQIVNIAPSMGFAVLNILALIVSAVAIFKIARLLDPAKLTGIFAVFLSTFGTSIFTPLERFATAFKLEPRTFPFHKFASANSNPLGFCLYFVCLFLVIRILSGRGRSLHNATGMVLSIAGMAFLYPLCWLAAGVACVSICLGQAVVKRGRDWQPSLIILLALFLGSVVAIPYLHSISAGKAATAAMAPNFHVWERLVRLFMISCLPLVILWLQRHQLKALYANRSSEVLALVYGGIGLVLLYIFVSIPDRCEYKFLMLLMAVIGILTAPLFAGFYQERRIPAMLVISLLLLPTANKFTFMFKQHQFADPVYTKGIDIVHYDTSMQKLYSWIAAETPADAVVVDSYLSVPALSGRSLYVGTDIRLNQEVPLDKRYKYFDGWSMEAKKLSKIVFGQDQQVVKRRLQNAADLLTPNNKVTVDLAAENVKREFDKRQVMVILRDPVLKPVYDDLTPRFTKLFEESSITVYRIN